MALTNTKRKLNDTSNGNGSYKQPRKRRLSDHEPLSSISNQAPKQPGNRHARGANKATKAKQAFDYISDSSADEVSAAKSPKAGISKAIGKKQKAPRSKSTSLDDSDVSTAKPTQVDTNTTSNVPLLAPSSPSSADAGSEEEGAAIEDEEDDDDDDDDEVEYTDSDNPPSDASTTSDTNDPNPTTNPPSPTKADNPTAFATSISHILNAKLTTAQRTNPILARSATAKSASSALLDQKLERRAKAEMKKKKEIEKGMHEDPLRVVAGSEQEVVREKELRKMAQRGVVKMFNAFNAARERAAEGKAKGGEGGGGSRTKREERATEMSKEGWLEFVGRGGKGEV